jgi:hypothetical protein
MNETPQFLPFIQCQHICWDNWVLELWEWMYNLTSLLALVDSIFYSPDYLIYRKDEISPSFYLGLIFTSLIRCYQHHLFFQLLWDSTIFFLPIWSWKTPRISLIFVIGGINVMTVVLPFRSYSSLIDHSCFKNASHLTLRGNSLSLNLNLSYLLIFLPLEICHNLCCHNFETICNTCERGAFIT